MPFSVKLWNSFLKQAAVFRIKWLICSFLLLTTLRWVRKSPIKIELSSARGVPLKQFLEDSHFGRKSWSTVAWQIITQQQQLHYTTHYNIQPERNVSWLDRHPQRPAICSCSAYKLISCCFHLLRDPLLVLSVYWQVYVMKRDGRVKRPANRSEFVHSFEFFKLCDEKLSLNSLHPTAQKTYL